MFRSLSVLLLLLLSSAIQANDISVFTKDRVSTKLTKLINAGTWTLVDFWALDCSICLIEKPKLAEFDLTRPDLEVIGVNLDGWDLRFDVENYLIEHKVGYTNILSLIHI